MNDACWTIEELVDHVALALDDLDLKGLDTRARQVPDVRTIRYYTTLGLLDRPGGYRGRRVAYGPKHLEQLIAIKDLQAQGLSLSEIQTRMASTPRPRQRQRERFWVQAPAEVGSEPQALRLGPGITLLVDEVAELDEATRRALRDDAAPLLERLRSLAPKKERS